MEAVEQGGQLVGIGLVGVGVVERPPAVEGGWRDLEADDRPEGGVVGFPILVAQGVEVWGVERVEKVAGLGLLLGEQVGQRTRDGSDLGQEVDGALGVHPAQG